MDLITRFVPLINPFRHLKIKFSISISRRCFEYKKKLAIANWVIKPLFGSCIANDCLFKSYQTSYKYCSDSALRTPQYNICGSTSLQMRFWGKFAKFFIIPVHGNFNKNISSYPSPLSRCRSRGNPNTIVEKLIFFHLLVKIVQGNKYKSINQQQIQFM